MSDDAKTPEPKYTQCRECKGTGRLPLSIAFAGICLRCNSTGYERVTTPTDGDAGRKAKRR